MRSSTVNSRGILSRNGGFTLVEILVATAMLVIVIGAVYGVFRAANQSSVMVEDNADVYQTARVLLSRITGELSSLHTIAGTQGSSLQGESASDSGNPPGFDTLTFTTVGHQPCVQASQKGDVCTVSYSAQCSQDGSPQGLFVTEDYTLGLRLNAADKDSLPSTKLSDMVVGMNCKYLDPDSSEWVDDWMSKTTLPTAVRIELIIQPRRKASQPVSVVSTVTLPTWAKS